MVQPKAHYASPLAGLSVISLSAGLVSLLALILTKPKCTPLSSRLQALLALSTLLFLSNILTITPLKILLYPLRSTDLVSSWRKRLVRVGLGIAYLCSLVGFLVIAFIVSVKISSVSDVKDSRVVGITGIVLFSVLALSIVMLGLTSPAPRPSTTVTWQDSSPATLHPLTPTPGDEKKQKPLVDDIPLPKSILVVLIFVVQIICLMLILGFGGAAAARGNVGGEACVNKLGAGLGKDAVVKVDVVEWHVPELYEEPEAPETGTHTLTLSQVFTQSMGGNNTEAESKSKATASGVQSTSGVKGGSSTTGAQAEATDVVVVTTETTVTVSG